VDPAVKWKEEKLSYFSTIWKLDTGLGWMALRSATPISLMGMQEKVKVKSQ